MKKKKSLIEIRHRGIPAQGRVIPYGLIMIGLFYICSTPTNVNSYVCYKGVLEKYDYTSSSLYIYVSVNELEKSIKLTVRVPSYRKQLKQILPNIKQITVWSKDLEIRQLETDGRIIIPYSWWVHTRIFWCFVAVGLFFLPFTERDWREWRNGEKAEQMMAKYGIDLDLFKSGFPIKSKKYNYYIVKENPLSKGNICVRLKKTKDKYPITLIYYTRNPQKTGDVSGETIRQFCYQLNFEFVPIENLPVTTTDYASANDPNLRVDIGKHYRKFLES